MSTVECAELSHQSIHVGHLNQTWYANYTSILKKKHLITLLEEKKSQIYLEFLISPQFLHSFFDKGIVQAKDERFNPKPGLLDIKQLFM